MDMPDEILARQIGDRLRALRKAHGLSLDALADLSGVGRSTISLIERGESSPTASVLNRLAAAFGLPLASLFDRAETTAGPLARQSDQPVWRDPHSGYIRRAVSPDRPDTPLRIVDVTFPPGASVAFETGVRGTVVHHQVYLLEGKIDLVVGRETHRLAAGDCLAFTLDGPTAFHNPSDRPARYLVVTTTGSVPLPSPRKSQA